jgi:hypothetical protein
MRENRFQYKQIKLQSKPSSRDFRKWSTLNGSGMAARYLVSLPVLQHCLTCVISFFHRVFNQQKVQILLGGVNVPIEFDDSRENT